MYIYTSLRGYRQYKGEVGKEKMGDMVETLSLNS